MTKSFGSVQKPTEIRLKKEEKILEVEFDNGVTFRYAAEFLRVHSPSAEVQGHSPDQRQLVPGRRHVGIIGVDPVGNYAIKIAFDDLHDTGIYSWERLYEFGQRYDEMWRTYRQELENAGLRRDP